jgi:outer membrane protein TolC
MNQLSDAVKMEVNQNYLSLKEANQRVAVLQKSVEQAEENYRITDSRHRNNLILLSELLDADNTLLNSKINLTLSRAEAQVAYYRLLKSTGGIQ